MEESQFVAAVVATCCNGLLYWKAMELMDYKLPEFDLGLNATQDSQLRRVLLVNELLKRAQGAEVTRLLQNIAKNEKGIGGRG